MKKFAENYNKLFNIKPKNILEIGSRDGDDAHFLKNYFNIQDDKVYIVEPNPPQANVIRLKYPNYKVFEFAISEFTGVLKFNSIKSDNDGIIGMSSLLKRGNIDDENNRNFLKSCENWINVLSINGKILLNLIGDSDIDIVKIDVEGATYNVVKSFGDDIRKIKYIHMECEHIQYWDGQVTYETIYNYMINKGYEQCYKIDYEWKQSDVVWIRK